MGQVLRYLSSRTPLSPKTVWVTYGPQSNGLHLFITDQILDAGGSQSHPLVSFVLLLQGFMEFLAYSGGVWCILVRGSLGFTRSPVAPNPRHLQLLALILGHRL